MAQDSSRSDFWETRYQQGTTPWDVGGIPPDFALFAAELPTGGRVFVPGCGSGHEVAWLAARGVTVEGIDFSPAAVTLAQQTLGVFAHCVRCGDVFLEDENQPYDWVYERALLCALPRRVWPDWAAKMARLVRPEGVLAGYFFFDDNLKGPPFGTSKEELLGLLSPYFTLDTHAPAQGSLPGFLEREHFMIWRRNLD